MRQARLAGVVVTAGVVVLLVGAFGLYGHPLTTLNEVQTAFWPHTFSAQAWKQHPHERYHMALDLARGKLLHGRTALWVVNLLGKPTRTTGHMDLVFAPGAVGRALQGGAELYWSVRSPQRPGDELIVFVDPKGAVTGWNVTSDPENGARYH